MAKPKVTVLNQAKKINPIGRERDNSLDLEIAEMKARGKYKGLQAPSNIDPGNNGTVTTS